MSVLRIVANIATDNVSELQRFHAELFGLTVVMDHGWFVTLASDETTTPQIGIAREGGSGAPVPDLSIEVVDVDETHRRARKMGCKMVYEITDEPWGVRRFFIADPAGKILNVLSHI
jgi:predicted enzyme related to lactoylglutathione lyase